MHLLPAIWLNFKRQKYVFAMLTRLHLRQTILPKNTFCKCDTVACFLPVVMRHGLDGLGAGGRGVVTTFLFQPWILGDLVTNGQSQSHFSYFIDFNHFTNFRKLSNFNKFRNFSKLSYFSKLRNFSIFNPHLSGSAKRGQKICKGYQPPGAFQGVNMKHSRPFLKFCNVRIPRLVLIFVTKVSFYAKTCLQKHQIPK